MHYSTAMTSKLSQQIMAGVTTYQPSTANLRVISEASILLMVGISGVGKNTLINSLLNAYPEKYERFITYTTRAPRSNNGTLERDGHDYHFIDMATAERMLVEQQFIEVNVYGNNLYGSSIKELQEAQRSGKTLIGDVDIHGVEHFQTLLPQTKAIFILPPSYTSWQERFVRRYGRQPIDQADWYARMQTAAVEIDWAVQTDVPYLLINDALDESTREVSRIASGERIEKQPARAIALCHQLLDTLKQTGIRA